MPNVGSTKISVGEVSATKISASEVGFAKVGFEVPDLDAEVARLELLLNEALVVRDFPPAKQRLVQVRDPEGNIVQLFARTSR